jgi:hypothetical protein
MRSATLMRLLEWLAENPMSEFRGGRNEVPAVCWAERSASSLMAALVSWAVISASVATLLTLLLLRINGSEGNFAQAAALLGSMLWVAGVLNAVFLFASLAVWPLFSTRLVSNSRGRRIAYFVSALLAFNLAWILWNHLQMAHQLASVHPFITITGVVEIISIALAALLV